MIRSLLNLLTPPNAAKTLQNMVSIKTTTILNRALLCTPHILFLRRLVRYAFDLESRSRKLTALGMNRGIDTHTRQCTSDNSTRKEQELYITQLAESSLSPSTLSHSWPFLSRVLSVPASNPNMLSNQTKHTGCALTTACPPASVLILLNGRNELSVST